MYVYVYMYMCICTCLYICRWLRVSVLSNRHSPYVRKYTGLPLYVYVYVDMYMCMYMFICICMCICTCLYICRWLRISVLSNRHSPTYESIRDYLNLYLQLLQLFATNPTLFFFEKVLLNYIYKLNYNKM